MTKLKYQSSSIDAVAIVVEGVNAKNAVISNKKKHEISMPMIIM